MAHSSIQQAIRELLADQVAFHSGELAAKTGLSRQALQVHLARAIEAGELLREGRGRGTRYVSPGASDFDRTWLTAGLDEMKVVEALEAWLGAAQAQCSPGAKSILGYAISELVNNAIDHSHAPEVRVRAQREADQLRVTIEDQGIGALESLRGRLDLEDHLHGLQELSKGKTTTQPDRHSGEGLFFTSKAVDRFRLSANGLCWIVDNTINDQTVVAIDPFLGTRVELELDLRTTRSTTDVFRRYTHDLSFDTSRCVIRLFEHGTTFVSRSQAKRLVTNLDRFREVILDFQGVESVGQGFVDEVFRVWSRRHPEVRLVPENMNREVDFMVHRGLGPNAGDPR